MSDSRALLEAVCRMLGALLSEEGTGRALNAFFCSSSPSFCMRASLAAFSLAATAAPGNWKALCVGAFVDLVGGGGVGKDIEIGRVLLCGMTTSFLSRTTAALTSVLPEGTRLLAKSGFEPLVCRTLLEQPSVIDGRGFPRVGAFLLVSEFWASESLA